MADPTFFMQYPPMFRISVLLADGALSAPASVTLDMLRMSELVVARPLFDVQCLTLVEPTASNPSFGGALPLTQMRDRELTAVIVPGLGLGCWPDPEVLLQSDGGQMAVEMLKNAHHDGAWIATSCAATFLAAQAKLLDGGRATTSWWLAPQFRSKFPAIDLQEDALTTEFDRALCGGGMLSHIELMLLLLGKLLDSAVVDQVARYSVSPRRGPQSTQARVTDLVIKDPLVIRLIAEIQANIASPLQVTDLVDRLSTSSRTLERRVQAVFGLSPIALIQRIRSEVAIELLQSTARPLKWVAEQVGYSDENTLRQLLIRTTGLTPKAIRRLS